MTTLQEQHQNKEYKTETRVLISTTSNSYCAILSNYDDFLYVPNKYVLPRHNNKKHDSTPWGITFSKSEEMFFKNVIFHYSNVANFSKLDNGPQKDQFLSKLIETFDLVDKTKVIILKYDETNKKYYIQNSQQIFDYLKNRFKYLKSSYLRTETKSYHLQSQSTIHSQNMFSTSIDEILSKSPIKFKNIYKQQDCIEVMSPDWPWYSMWHTLVQEASIILYSGSHRLKHNAKIHRCTKLKLQFPSEKAFMLLFDGRTVHCGDYSRVEKDSFNYSHDARLFSYVTLNGNNDAIGQKRKTRTKGEIEYSQRFTNKIDTNSFKMCSCISKGSYDMDDTVPDVCTICDPTIDSMKTWNYHEQAIIVDILSEHRNKKNNNCKYNKHSPGLVCGDIEEYGWAVYEGINFNHFDYIKLRSDMMKLIHDNSWKQKWIGLQNSCTKTNNRKMLDIGSLENVSSKSSTKEDLSTIQNIFTNIESRLQSIVYFKTACLTSRVVLANFGFVPQQQQHRDYDLKSDNTPETMN